MSLRSGFLQGAILAIGVAGSLGELGCSLPEYKLLVSNIPEGSTRIEAAIYLPQPAKLLRDQVSAAIPAGKVPLSVLLDLQGTLDQPERAVFGVATRDASGCITATSNTAPVAPSESVADVPVRLNPLVNPSAATDRCGKTPPILVDVQRGEQGYFGNADKRLLLAGWGFVPTDKVTIKSQIQFSQTLCRSQCRMRCPDVRPCSNQNLGAMCQTGCSLTGTMEYAGPGLLLLHLPEQAAVEEPPPPPPQMTLARLDVSGAELLGSPIAVTVAAADGSAVTTFVEQ